MNKANEKVYIHEGDIVTLKGDVTNAPTRMLVHKVEKMSWIENGEPSSRLVGIWCVWFKADGQVEKMMFNTKDLVKVKDE